MAFNVAALACLAGAIITALFLCRRYLPLHGTAGGDGGAATHANVCLRCGTPAQALASFTCPGCAQDVRDAGLGPPRGSSPLRLFWTLVAFTCAYVVAAMVAGGVALNSLPTVYVTSYNVTMNLASPEIRGVELYLDAVGPDGDRRGAVTGDLYGSAGVVTFEANVPGRRWRLLDPAGKELAAGTRLDGTVVYRWMELAGIPSDTPAAHSDAAQIASSLGRLAGVDLEMPPVPGTGRAMSLSYSSSTGGGTSAVRDPRWPPLLVVGAAALWLAAFYFILRSHRPRDPAGAAPAATAATATPQGVPQ